MRSFQKCLQRSFRVEQGQDYGLGAVARAGGILWFPISVGVEAVGPVTVVQKPKKSGLPTVGSPQELVPPPEHQTL